MTNRTLMGASLLAGAVALGGCGSAAHTAEYRNANETIQQAKQSAAAQHAPDELHQAQRTMQQAEAADDGSLQERDYAYIADRQARIAMANGNRRALESRQEEADREYRRTLETANQAREQAIGSLDRQLGSTSDRLEEVRRELSERGEVLDERTRELQAREQELTAQQQQLEQEQQARAQAEQEAQQALEELAEVRQDQENMVITLNGEVLFASGQTNLIPSATRRLEAVARVLQNHPDRQIVVEGHTDSQGPDGMNRELSRERAERVREFLVRNGVPEGNIRSVGRGESEPIANNRSAEGRANNRRVEIVVEQAQAK